MDEETGSDAPETKSPRMGFRGWDSGEREGWMGSGAGAGSGGVSDTPPREIPPRGVIGLLLGAECGRLKRRLPVLLRCRGGAIGPPER